MMRPRVAAPTGTATPLPVPVTLRPWRRPSEVPIAIARTMPSPSLLLHFEGQLDVIELEGVVDLGDLIAWKSHIDDRADDPRIRRWTY